MKKIAVYVFLGILAFSALFPLFYLFINSFGGYREVFWLRPHYLVRFWRSMLMSTAILGGQLVMAVLGGYAFARFRFPGRGILFFLIVLIMMMPLQVTLVPQLIVADALNINGTYAAIILPGMFSAFGVFLMRQVMGAIPNSLFESAKLDGADSFKALWYVCLPNCKHALAALAVLNFAESWNMVEQPLVFLRHAVQYPLAVYLVRPDAVNPEAVFAAGVLSVLPVLMIFLWFKDEIAFGIEYSVVK
jgi:multiple sugar transport system permease protein